MEIGSSQVRADNATYMLRLPEPHSNIVITCPQLEDTEAILPILNDVLVYPWMGSGLPVPHLLVHAQNWLKSVKPRCDLAQEDLQAISDGKIAPEPQSIRACPVRIIREVVEDREIYLGDCGIERWGFPDVIDKEERARYKRENEAKSPSDPTIIWSLGYYLKPSHHGKGIMKATISTLLNWATTNMNVRHMRTTAMEVNEPSVKVLQQNGFVVEKTLPEFASKAGVKVGLHVLEWKAAP